MTILALEDLKKCFKGFVAVDGVSLAVAAGEMVALIGPNGAGKTTTFNMANGHLPPDRGRVLLEGRDVTGLPARVLWRLGLGRTFQITATFASMSVAENILVALLSRDREFGLIGRAEMRHGDEISALLSEVGMEHARDSICGVLSYGDLKRVEMAVALAHAPRLLLMDEPTAGMAPRERAQLMSLVTKIAHDRSTAVLFTEHDMSIVFRHASRVVVMNRGKIVAEGAPEEVRRDPTVREIYLGRSTASR